QQAQRPASDRAARRPVKQAGSLLAGDRLKGPGVHWMTSGWYVLIGPEGFGGAMNPLPPTPISSPRSRSSRRRLLAGAGACLLAPGTTGAIAAVVLAATSSPVKAQVTANAQAAAVGANWYESAPYYSTLDSSGPDLGQVMAATGQKAFEMAFI